MFKKIISPLITLTLILTIFSCSKEESSNTKKKSHEISQDFVQGSEDIPLLKDMKKIKEESLGFDSASGSIMSSSYESVLKINKIKSFYIKTLPKMGWTNEKTDDNGLKFIRDNENLEIDFSSNNNKTIIRFFISYDL